MSKLKIEIDTKAISAQLNGIKNEIEDALYHGVQELAASTHAKVVEMAQQELHTTRDKYLKALDFEEIVNGVWVVSLDLKQVGWLEEGKPPGSMIDDLLKNNPKISKEGFRYKAIPFEHSKEPSQLNEKAKQYVQTIKNELKKRGIPFKKIETDPSGNPRLGKLHTFNIESPRPSERAKTPALYGLSIYQRQTKDNKVRRDIMTFRVVSDKHKAEGLWFHPGVEAKKFLDRAKEWGEKTFENEILPRIFEKFK